MRKMIGILSSIIFSANTFATDPSPVEKTLPPLLVEAIHCKVLPPTSDRNAGKMKFEIYLTFNERELDDAILSGKSMPGLILQQGVPFFGNIKVIYTNAQIILAVSANDAMRFEATIKESYENPLVLKGDLLKVDGDYSGEGTVDIKGWGSQPMKCTTAMHQEKKALSNIY